MAPTKIKSESRTSTSKITVNQKSVKVESKDNQKKQIFRPDSKQTATLIKAGREGAANAIRASKALGLSITYLRNGVLYLEQPDGTKSILANTEIEKGRAKKSKIQLKKGMVLHAKK